MFTTNWLSVDAILLFRLVLSASRWQRCSATRDFTLTYLPAAPVRDDRPNLFVAGGTESTSLLWIDAPPPRRFSLAIFFRFSEPRSLARFVRSVSVGQANFAIKQSDARTAIVMTAERERRTGRSELVLSRARLRLIRDYRKRGEGENVFFM